MSSNRTSSPGDLRLEDDGLEIVEPPTTATTNRTFKPDTDRVSPANTESGVRSDTVTTVLQQIGYFAEKKLQESGGLSRAPTVPHLKELRKLVEYPNGESTNMPGANSKAKAVSDRIALSQALNFVQTTSGKTRKKKGKS